MCKVNHGPNVHVITPRAKARECTRSTLMCALPRFPSCSRRCLVRVTVSSVLSSFCWVTPLPVVFWAMSPSWRILYSLLTCTSSRSNVSSPPTQPSRIDRGFGMRERRGCDLRRLNTSKKVCSQETLRVFNLDRMALRRSIIIRMLRDVVRFPVAVRAMERVLDALQRNPCWVGMLAIWALLLFLSLSW